MFKKKIVTVILICLCCFSFSITSFATSSLSPYTKIRMNRPTTSDNSGYLELVVKNGSAYEVYVYFWYGNGTDNSLNETEFRENITINFSSVSFTPMFNEATQVTLCIITSINETEGHGILSQSGGSYTHDIGKQVLGYHVYGNYGTVSTYSGFFNNGFDVSYADDDETVYHLIQLYNQLVQSNENDEVMIEKINSIMNSNSSIDSKMSQLVDLQEDTNTWLEKIFNYLKESPEKQKQEAQTQGNNSTSQGMNAIEDKGGDFSGSLGGLTNSMSYTGTDCSWTFPTVKLPAIAGVMDEVTLIESQPIDFSFWVNAIPSGIMLIIQSVLTIGLIVYCFKELYSTIAYVLTLRKDDNS